MFAKMRSGRGSNMIVELLMLVVGINIALWFEGRFEEMQEAETEQQYLRGLRDDLYTDLDSLNLRIEENDRKVESILSILPTLDDLEEATPKQQARTFFEPSSYNFFQPANFTYVSMQESGDFRLLTSNEIKRELLRLMRTYRLVDEMQTNFIQALDDVYIPLLMKGFDLANQRLSDASVVEDQVFKNFFAFTLQETGQRLHVLRQAMQQVEELLHLIELEIK